MQRHCTASLLKNRNASLIVLNWSFPRRVLEHLWHDAASLTICADGAANRVLKSDSLRSDKKLIPDFVCGDLDSLDPGVVPGLEASGTQIIRSSCQDSNDLEKCIEVINNEALKHTEGSFMNNNIIIVGAFGGRLDQEMANLNVAVRWANMYDIILFSKYSMARILPAGFHEIIPDQSLETSTCGLVPLGCPCEQVSTTGLKYNLTGHRLAFGETISSSNSMLVECPRVTVNTSHPLLWTTSLSWDNYLNEKA